MISFLANPKSDFILSLNFDRYLPKSLGPDTPSSALGLKVKVTDQVMDFRCAFKLLRPRCNQNSWKI